MLALVYQPSRPTVGLRHACAVVPSVQVAEVFIGASHLEALRGRDLCAQRHAPAAPRLLVPALRCARVLLGRGAAAPHLALRPLRCWPRAARRARGLGLGRRQLLQRHGLREGRPGGLVQQPRHHHRCDLHGCIADGLAEIRWHQSTQAGVGAVALGHLEADRVPRERALARGAAQRAAQEAPGLAREDQGFCLATAKSSRTVGGLNDLLAWASR
mmetsp:Transcript_101581/g.326477  ORF Transcript_101581/g.326477 Transcript_101581/m.326477 type:complete len:215 (-) Transcript_101581:125-769(-)